MNGMNMGPSAKGSAVQGASGSATGTDAFDRDPCDGCEGDCGDVCPVLEAKRESVEREYIAQVISGARAAQWTTAQGEHYRLEMHRHAEESSRLRAENEALKADLVRVVRTQEELRSRLRRVSGFMNDARQWLTPGLKAGVADARATLKEGIELALSPAPGEAGESRPSTDGSLASAAPLRPEVAPNPTSEASS